MTQYNSVAEHSDSSPLYMPEPADESPAAEPADESPAAGAFVAAASASAGPLVNFRRFVANPYVTRRAVRIVAV